MQKASGIREGTGGAITALCFGQIFGENYVHSMINKLYAYSPLFMHFGYQKFIGYAEFA